MDLKTVIEIVVLIAGGGVAYGIFQTTVTTLKEENREQWVTITKIRDWVTIHEKDSAMIRLDMEKSLGHIREDASKSWGKMDILITMISELSKKLDKVEEKIEKKEK